VSSHGQLHSDRSVTTKYFFGNTVLLTLPLKCALIWDLTMAIVGCVITRAWGKEGRALEACVSFNVPLAFLYVLKVAWTP
jgi:hypothetical protein